ncbi:UNVERIFIED_CONTAM: hypothetical protein GTU68_007333 [Idotea baltica]|nr:hypothetical protein [Idotea baltica]
MTTPTRLRSPPLPTSTPPLSSAVTLRLSVSTRLWIRSPQPRASSLLRSLVTATTVWPTRCSRFSSATRSSRTSSRFLVSMSFPKKTAWSLTGPVEFSASCRSQCSWQRTSPASTASSPLSKKPSTASRCSLPANSMTSQSRPSSTSVAQSQPRKRQCSSAKTLAPDGVPGRVRFARGHVVLRRRHHGGGPNPWRRRHCLHDRARAIHWQPAAF